MRIHLSLDPKHLVQPVAGPSSGPLVNIGGDLVLVELQGELNHEGDKADGVVGILGLDRPDKPTLHLGEHHLLHGKMATLSKPYAVIRRALALVPAEGAVGEVEGDAEEEDHLEDDLLAMDKQTPNRPSAKNSGKGEGKGKEKEKEKADEEEDEGPLFPDITPPQTPKRGNGNPSSSPSSIYPSSAMKDYSSELDFSSPPVSDTSKRDREDDSDSEDEEEEEEERRRKKAKKFGKKERTRRYEVVGIVRKKVVFALRPEPIVTATILPE